MKSAALLLLIATPAVAEPLRSVVPTMLEGVCAITGAGVIQCEREHALPSIDLVARDFVPAYHPIIVRDDGRVVRVKQRAFSDDKITPDPVAVSFKVRSAGLIGSAKNDQLCVFGEKGELACGPFDHSNESKKITFTKVAGRFAEVTFAHDVLWAIDDRGALWCGGAYDCARLYAAANKAPKKPLLELASMWPSPTDTPADAPLWRVTDGVKHVYGSGSPCIERASDPKTLVCWSFSDGPTVYPRPKGDEIATIGMFTCARTGDSISCTMPGSEAVKPFTVTVKDAVKMHYANMSFCVETKKDLRCAKMGNPLPPFEAVMWASRTKKE